jgi:hypothetical protein
MHGVELDSKAAALARNYESLQVGSVLDEVVLQSVRDAGPFEAILLLDVLEHLPQPDVTLTQLLETLCPSGIVLISVPNVAHWSIRKSLLNGHWDYTPSGILDATHLRFFTLNSARRMISRAGLAIEVQLVSPSRLPRLPSLPRVEHLLARRWPEMFGVQLLFAARPRASLDG